MKRREEGEVDVKRTEKILRRLERCERRKRGRDVEGCEGDQDLGEVRSEDEVFEIVDVAEDAKNDEEMAVNEEDRLDSGGGGGAGDDDEWGVGDEDWGSWGKDELDPGLVKAGRREEVEYIWFEPWGCSSSAASRRHGPGGVKGQLPPSGWRGGNATNAGSVSCAAGWSGETSSHGTRRPGVTSTLACPR